MSTEYFGRVETVTEYCTYQDCLHTHECRYNVAVSNLPVEKIEGKEEIDAVACVADGFAKYWPIDEKKG